MSLPAPVELAFSESLWLGIWCQWWCKREFFAMLALMFLHLSSDRRLWFLWYWSKLFNGTGSNNQHTSHSRYKYVICIRDASCSLYQKIEIGVKSLQPFLFEMRWSLSVLKISPRKIYGSSTSLIRRHGLMWLFFNGCMTSRVTFDKTRQNILFVAWPLFGSWVYWILSLYGFFQSLICSSLYNL